MGLIRRLLLGVRAERNERLLVDIRQVFGNHPSMRVAELLTALVERRPIYRSWSEADLVTALGHLGIRVSRRRTVTHTAVMLER